MPEPVVAERSPIHQPSLIETVNLNAHDAQRIFQQAIGFRGEGIYADNFEQRAKAIRASSEMTHLMDYLELGSKLRNLKNGRSVVVIVQGLPTDPQIPAPPVDGGSPKNKPTFVSEAIMLGMAGALGYPSILLGEKKEALIHQVTPVPGQELTQSNEGAIDLGFHQDLAPNPEIPYIRYAQFMPDFLILNGVQKGSGDTETFVSPLDDALKLLDEKTKKILMGNSFITDPPDSFLKTLGYVAAVPSHPVLIDYQGHMESAIDFSSGLRPKNPTDKSAREALDKLKIALEQVKQAVKIEPGTAVAFNNRRVIHGRGAVDLQTAHLEKKRWLQRIYVFNTERVFRETMDNPAWSVEYGGGLVRVKPNSPYRDKRIAELAGNGSK